MEPLLKVLVVDDDSDCANLVRDMLVEHEYDVEVRYDSEDAYILITETETAFDLLIFDIEMPCLDGVTLAKRLRGKGITTPIIFVTGGLKNGIKRSVHGMGHSVSYLIKPVKMDHLEAKCTEMISKTQLYVQVGRTHQMIKSLERTVTEKMLTISGIQSTVRLEIENHVQEKFPLDQAACRESIGEMLVDATSPEALMARVQSNRMARIIGGLVFFILTSVASLILYNNHLASSASREVIEVRECVKTISNSMTVQSQTISRIDKRLDKLDLIDELRSGAAYVPTTGE